MEIFKVVDANPNEASGVGQCLCSPTKVESCKPPYVVFYNHETDAPTDPFTVGCAACICAAAKACEKDKPLGVKSSTTVPEVLQSAARQSTSKPKRDEIQVTHYIEPDVIEAVVVEEEEEPILDI